MAEFDRNQLAISINLINQQVDSKLQIPSLSALAAVFLSAQTQATGHDIQADSNFTGLLQVG